MFTLLLIASKMVPKEPEIMKIKTLQTIREDKTKSKKKNMKKRTKFGRAKETGIENIDSGMYWQKIG